MLMNGHFYMVIPYEGNTGFANKTVLKIGTYQFPYVEWHITGYEIAVDSNLYLRIPSGYIDGVVRDVHLNDEHIRVEFDGMWQGKYNGLLYGKCEYGKFRVYPHTGIVYESRFFPEGHDWALPLELYHLISGVAHHQGLRPSKKLTMESFVELCFAAGLYCASQNLGQTVSGIEEQISRLMNPNKGLLTQV